ncbi:hypothetical protein STRDD10_00421 [Streptococcus sp. DD10]|uniref:type IV secretion system protein n=1 Tax=Streptococcus sp. DD10 TaxID=1777878 RepID=UPI000791C338|nr:type IV secretion system protein [Streptococcus sp. DD10]KXT75185.1 hypothetical protein STRDD10_00421 [Streptococcus sp. DD10]
MNLDIGELTNSLSNYSSSTNQAVTSVANAVRPIGFILVGLFFLFEMMSWHQMMKSRGDSLTTKMWVEISMKYLIAFLLVWQAALICDALVELVNIIIKVIAKVAPQQQNEYKYAQGAIKGWLNKSLFTLIGWCVEFVANIVLSIVIFLRYLDLYILKSIAPLLVAFFMMDSLRSITINFLKYVAASAFIGGILIVTSIVYSSLVTNDLIQVAGGDADGLGTAFASIAKGVIYIFVMIGSGRKARQLLGV